MSWQIRQRHMASKKAQSWRIRLTLLQLLILHLKCQCEQTWRECVGECEAMATMHFQWLNWVCSENQENVIEEMRKKIRAHGYKRELKIEMIKKRDSCMDKWGESERMSERERERGWEESSYLQHNYNGVYLTCPESHLYNMLARCSETIAATSQIVWSIVAMLQGSAQDCKRHSYGHQTICCLYCQLLQGLLIINMVVLRGKLGKLTSSLCVLHRSLSGNQLREIPSDLFNTTYRMGSLWVWL